MEKERGHVKTFSAALGSGFVELEGKSYPFDVGALSEVAETVRSGDLVEVELDDETVLGLKPVHEAQNDAVVASEDEEPDLDDIASQVTLKASGETPARFNMDTFKRKASRLDFK
jgi:hypothetical protein